MSIKVYNKTNFHKHTFCLFTEAEASSISTLKLNYKSKSGSSYYFTIEGVYRLSNHWGRAANCKWRLISLPNLQTNSSFDKRTKLGFARWTDFYPDNDFERLYFIEVDFESATVSFNHKLSADYSSNKIVRTAGDTSKRIKQIRSLLEETAWAKHFPHLDILELRKKIILQLITTNQSFNEIRSYIVRDSSR